MRGAGSTGRDGRAMTIGTPGVVDPLESLKRILEFHYLLGREYILDTAVFADNIDEMLSALRSLVDEARSTLEKAETKTIVRGHGVTLGEAVTMLCCHSEDYSVGGGCRRGRVCGLDVEERRMISCLPCPSIEDVQGAEKAVELLEERAKRRPGEVARMIRHMVYSVYSS